MANYYNAALDLFNDDVFGVILFNSKVAFEQIDQRMIGNGPPE